MSQPRLAACLPAGVARGAKAAAGPLELSCEKPEAKERQWRAGNRQWKREQASKDEQSASSGNARPF